LDFVEGAILVSMNRGISADYSMRPRRGQSSMAISYGSFSCSHAGHQPVLMQIDDRMVNISPGMAVTVEIKIGSRMILSYLLSPLLRYRQEPRASGEAPSRGNTKCRASA
jgi:hypothetical protein